MWSKKANTGTGWVFSSANQLVMKGKRFQILLPEVLRGGLIFGEKIISSDQGYSFKKNLNIPLYIAPRGYSRCKITANGAIFITIRTFATFVG